MKRLRAGATRWAWAALVLASIVTWWPTWNEPFAEDDFLFLEVAGAAGPARLLTYFGTEGVMDHHYRPLSDPLWYGFATTPARYHLGLQLLHATAAVLVLSLGAALGLGSGAAFLGALLWVTRDFAFPAMIWASGFPDLGSTVLALASLRTYVAFRQNKRRATGVGSVVFFVAALLTKETAIVTLPLLLVVEWLGGFLPQGERRVPRATPWEIVKLSAPYALVGIPLAVVQIGLARFDDAYGQSLYALSAGMHTVWLWPVYAFWSLLALPSIAESIPVRGVLVLVALGLLGAGIVRWARRRATITDLGLAWFSAAILPALFAPARINTNYVMLAAVGPCLALGGLFAAWLGSERSRRLLAACSLVLLILAGPVLVIAKDTGRVASGGWLDPARSRAAATLVETVSRGIAPDLPTNSLLILFGAADLNPMLLANLGEGFGPQSGLQSAFRRAYGRRDVRVATLPPLQDTPPANLEALRRVVLENADAIRLLDAQPPVVELTASAVAAARASSNVVEFRRALAAARLGAR